jgi:hypothetical protein
MRCKLVRALPLAAAGAGECVPSSEVAADHSAPHEFGVPHAKRIAFAHAV